MLLRLQRRGLDGRATADTADAGDTAVAATSAWRAYGLTVVDPDHLAADGDTAGGAVRAACIATPGTVDAVSVIARELDRFDAVALAWTGGDRWQVTSVFVNP